MIHYCQSLISKHRKVTCSLEHNRKPYDIAATITNVFISMVLLRVTTVETEITTSQCIKYVSIFGSFVVPNIENNKI